MTEEQRAEYRARLAALQDLIGKLEAELKIQRLEEDAILELLNPAPAPEPDRARVEGKDFRGKAFKPKANTDYVECLFGNSTRPVINGPMPKGVRLLQCRVENVKLAKQPGDHGSQIFYVNNGHKEDPIDLLIDGLVIDDCSCSNFFELKASGVTIRNCVQNSNCRIPQTVRLRHGRDHVVTGNRGFTEICARGWRKWIVDNPGAKVILYAGNLPARYEDWGSMHVAGGGSNMQCCELAYVEGVGSVHVGYVSRGRDKYPALNCVVDPEQENVMEGRLSPDHNWRRHLSGMAEIT